MERKTLLLFGDSNTYGYSPAADARLGEAERWTCLVRDALNGWQVHEEGLCGRTAAFRDPVGDNLCGMDMLLPLLATQAPVDMLVIMLGTNDVKARFGATAENIGKGVARLIHLAQCCEHFAKDARILLIAPPPIEPSYARLRFAGEMGEGCSEKSRALGAIYEDVAKDAGCLFLNAADIKGVEMSELDGMHLSTAAHAALAHAVIKIIKSGE